MNPSEITLKVPDWDNISPIYNYCTVDWDGKVNYWECQPIYYFMEKRWNPNGIRFVRNPSKIYKVPVPEDNQPEELVWKRPKPFVPPFDKIASPFDIWSMGSTYYTNGERQGEIDYHPVFLDRNGNSCPDIWTLKDLLPEIAEKYGCGTENVLCREDYE